jgi:hypothetical protein
VAFRLGGGSGQTHANTYANSQVPSILERGNFHSSLTNDLQLKWSFLGSEGMGQGGVRVRCSKSRCMVSKSPKLSLKSSLSQVECLLCFSPSMSWPCNKSVFSALHGFSLFGIQGQVGELDMWKPGSFGLGSKTPVSDKVGRSEGGKKEKQFLFPTQVGAKTPNSGSYLYLWSYTLLSWENTCSHV